MAEFFKMVNGYARPDWAGPITISNNGTGRSPYDPLIMTSPWTIEGIVVPVYTTGRRNPPKPLSGALTGKSVGTDKGHMFALELGGPDVSENIAPQSSLWQQSGGWRQLENDILRLALDVMQWAEKYDPAGTSNITLPKKAIFLTVRPETRTDSTGQPESYIGSATEVFPFLKNAQTNSWGYYHGQKTHIFVIQKNGVTWKQIAGTPKTWRRMLDTPPIAWAGNARRAAAADPVRDLRVLS